MFHVITFTRPAQLTKSKLSSLRSRVAHVILGYKVVSANRATRPAPGWLASCNTGISANRASPLNLGSPANVIGPIVLLIQMFVWRRSRCHRGFVRFLYDFETEWRPGRQSVCDYFGKDPPNESVIDLVKSLKQVENGRLIAEWTRYKTRTMENFRAK